eukprot:TRINITY_DN55035_c0_g1_i1.p1 TRINITY_DN55035_c0_g1~~TRINITY_DN55035_c0_g1_i1.p1  ORF type:complete len:516 (+),score=74.66 TRINITY_DN55035_c0_g1_i1:83-1630(+)
MADEVATPRNVQATIVGEDDWGSIQAILDEPLQGVTGDETWLSVLGFYLLLPLNVIVAVVAGFCDCVFVRIVLGSAHSCWCCCRRDTSHCSILHSVRRGRPRSAAFLWWWYSGAALVRLVRARSSRLAFFFSSWTAFGKGSWFQAAGIWSYSYPEVESILQSNQTRTAAFACSNAPIPDIFSPKLLLFLSNEGTAECEWAAIRAALHQFLLDQGSTTYQTRVGELHGLIAKQWTSPTLSDTDDFPLLQRIVSKCLFYVLFGVWLNDSEANVIAGWRRLAGIFVFGRLLHRVVLNSSIRKVKKLRKETISIVENNGLKWLFLRMNESLPEAHRRTPVVRLCDEVMLLIGIGGVGGTSALVETVGQFLQLKKPPESASKRIDFSKYQTSQEMIGAYMDDPSAYIKEAARLDPPVTSATRVLSEPTTVKLAGRSFEFPAGSLNQYVISMANRDDSVFPDPDVFDPRRANSSAALTWNGAFGRPHDEYLYPRMCPGRFLSLDITKTIMGHALSLRQPVA